MKLSLVLSLILLFAGGVSGEYLKDMSVTKVVDGDTVYASYKGKIHKMRLLEIDAPERDQPIGTESTAFLKELLKNHIININIIGEKTNISKDILNIFKSLIKKKNPTINLNIVFNYGSLDEIVYIVNNFIINKNKKINKNSVRSSMYLGNIPDPDILIRTGGYQRLSNFILLNLSYTELFFTNTLWPDFSHNELESILLKFSKVNRNYGL